jgi:hypothetical protein
MAVVFTLMSIAGAWAAWRHSPFRTGQSGWRVVGILLLLVAAATGAIVAAVNLMQGLSEALQLGVLGTVIVVTSLAMIFSMQAVATPKAARLVTSLPPSARVATVHRQKFYGWMKYALGFFAVCGAGCFIPGDIKYAFLGAGGIGLILALVCLPIMYVNARAMDRSLTDVELNWWVHWQYSAQAWQEWSDIQAQRLSQQPQFSFKRSWRRLIAPFLTIAICMMFFSPESTLVNAALTLGTCGALAGILEAGVWGARRAPARLKAKLHDAAPEVFFGHDGVYCNGRFTTWFASEYLTLASIDPRPPRSLLLRFERIVPNPYGPAQTIVIDQGVLIPEDGDCDIAKLQRELAVRVPSAHVALA